MSVSPSASLFYLYFWKLPLYLSLLKSYNLVLISSEMTMEHYMNWPKFGWKLIFISFIMVLGLTILCSFLIIRMAIDNNLVVIVIVLSVSGQIPNCFAATYFLFNMIFFIITWIETFGNICTKNSVTNIISHTEKCLKFFATLQKGLGEKFIFSIFFNLYF